MAQRRIFYQPQPRRRSDDEQDTSTSFQPVQPVYNPTQRLQQSKNAANQAGGLLDSIDQELGREGNTSNAQPRQSISARDARSAKNSRIQQAEIAAARRNPASRTSRDVGAQEGSAHMPSAENLYRKSAENRKKGGRRGLFIGLGAGGGLVSVVAGFMFLLPFKLPAIMDTVINDAGKRVEHVVEKRGERILLRFFLRGSSAACTLENCIATGNPIGDLFANIRTSSFEKDLLDRTGLEFKPGPNKTVKLVSNGKDLGEVKNADDILKILDKSGSLSRSDIRKIVKTQIPVWRFFKRAKFVNWLRLKYNVPRFGSRKQDPKESDDAYNKAVQTDITNEVESPISENLNDFINCVNSSGGDCKGSDGNDTKALQQTDKLGGAEDLQKRTTQAMNEVTTEIEKGATPAADIGKTFMQRVVGKIFGQKVADLIPFFGEIDLGARLQVFIRRAQTDSVIQKMHANYMKLAYVVAFATYAGYADQTKAGDLGTSAVGMIADKFNGAEDAQSYNLINSGQPIGQGLDPVQKIGETYQNPEWLKVVGTIYGLATLPAEAWYYTVSQVLDVVGGWVGNATSWIMSHIPGINKLMEMFANVMGDLFAGLFSLIGMDVDPFDTGAKLHLDVHAGAVAAFSGNCKDMGCRKLTHDQALAQDRQAYLERKQDLASESLGDRLFNLDNEESLASTILTGLPTPQSTDPLGSLALTGGSLLARVPTSFANIIMPSAQADTLTTSEDLYAVNAWGGLDGSDLDADPAPELYNANPKCPDNSPDGSTFNTCAVDEQIVSAMNCSFVKCSDMQADNGNTMFDTFADVGTSNPVVDTLPVEPPSSHLASQKSGGANWFASLLPMVGLELSRRKQ